MSKEEVSIVAFDVLLRGETDSLDVSLEDLAKHRPTPEAIERCFRWFCGKGVTCHKTNFGLGCEATVELFQSLFGVQLKRMSGDQPHYQIDGVLRVPDKIAELVAQVTLTVPPSLFS